MNARVHPAVFFIPIAMLVIGLGAMPWGYYQLLRLVVAAACEWVAAVMFTGKKEGAGFVFAALALAYNPFVPLRLGRGSWEVINVATIALLLAGFAINRKKSDISLS